jgi:hypothetical protein
VTAASRPPRLPWPPRASRPPAILFSGLLDNFVARHVRPNLRSADEVERAFRVYVRPKLGSRSIYELRRKWR